MLSPVYKLSLFLAAVGFNEYRAGWVYLPPTMFGITLNTVALVECCLMHYSFANDGNM